MTKDLRKAVEQALKQMDDHMMRADTQEFYEAKEALRQALEEKQEPVLWMCHDCGGANQLCPHGHKDAPLYTAPPKKQWVGLTDEEVSDVIDDVLEGGGWLDVARAIEQALKEKNT